MNFQKAVELINKSESILLTCHDKPDGDACGSIVALSEALGALGKNVKPLFLSPLPEWYKFLLGEEIPVLGEAIEVEELIEGRFGEFDLIIVVEGESAARRRAFVELLAQQLELEPLERIKHVLYQVPVATMATS